MDETDSDAFEKGVRAETPEEEEDAKAAGGGCCHGNVGYVAMVMVDVVMVTDCDDCKRKNKIYIG